MLHFLKRVYWTNTFFLSGTLLAALTAAPWYLWHFGWSWAQFWLFFFFLISTGISITLGYHRLFSHLTFRAAWPVKLFTLLFGAAAFESSALTWCADHRRHHKHVDHEDDDPYAITRGFFHAHIGWLLFRHAPETPLTWVRDLQKDRLAVWQHRHYVAIAIFMGFLLPTFIGFLLEGAKGALGGFLHAGAARIVLVHHMTFCINSLCHWIGSRPYSGKCSARDSFLMALVTFGEGYHNYHHEFQYDYRNGVKPWQWDPTKWTIWLLAKVGLVSDLRTVSEDRILRAELHEKNRLLEEALKKSSTPLSDAVRHSLDAAHERVESAIAAWQACAAGFREGCERSRAARDEAWKALQNAVGEWRQAYSSAMELSRAAAV